MKLKMDQSPQESPETKQRKQTVSGIFDRAATTFGQVGPRYFSYFGRRLVELAQIPSGAKVLDVATGRGALLFPAAKSAGLHGQVTGIDISENMVQETIKELADLELAANVVVRQMDAEYLQFPDESFDFVLCGFAIFFFPQLDRALAEFRRVLKPQGHICVTTWAKSDERWKWFDEIVDRYLPPENEPPPITDAAAVLQPVFDTPEGLQSILDKAGFANIQILPESADFVYTSAEEYWATLWSHGVRGTLEEITRVKGQAGLEMFKSDIFKKVAEIRQVDGLHAFLPVLVGLATKP